LQPAFFLKDARSMKRLSPLVAAVVLGFAGGSWIVGQQPSLAPAPALAQSTVLTSATPVAAVPAAALTAEEQRNIHVYETANRSVVNIDTTMIEVDSLWGMQREAEGSGSGIVIDQQGHILTNYHVIDGTQNGPEMNGSIKVTLASNDETYPAALIGGDKEFDIAILKIDAPADKLFPVAMGSSDQLRVGQRVFAVGNPFGWDGTMTTGIISSLNRNLPSRVPGRQMQALIQTDAAMNPGNSGGPLLNSNAEMIGMCVAIASRTGQNSGVGFAIPINRIRSILPDVMTHGHVVRADIGISEVMETSNGLIIGRLNPDGPAAKAGLRGFEVVVRRQGPFVQTSIDRSKADRIVAIDGDLMQTGVQFRDKIWDHRPGDVVTLTVVRGGQQLDVEVTLGGA
jgi:S1-C subfamily serine protease